MAPTRTRKRKSDMSSPTTASPIKKQRKMGLSALQKQALIDNLQLELTERARRLRAQYNVQAQHLRSRVEMRINRIPTALRKTTMGELLAKSLEPPKPKPTRPAFTARPPPVPAKDGTSPMQIARKPVTKTTVATNAASRGLKRLSEDFDGNKENQNDAVDNPKKRVRAAPAVAKTMQTHQILSPTTSNARIIPARERPASPTKSMLGRPVSPVKSLAAKSSSNLLSNMVEKAKGIRSAATSSRKTTASSTASSSSSTAAATTATTARGRKAAAPSTTAAPATTRGRRKISAASESSEGSTATVVKKTPASRATGTKAAAAVKRPGTAMSTTKSAAAKKAAPVKTATTPAATGRTLRKRAAV
ncbi:Borealin N terminal-domain-containing protein [Microdochium trichocladiopsis]|uniref:Borealin N terminal-domain-containing protein n=1 Tax=Microdochium trichocladiopsis TaxID=1682393 RepID=A0A9P8Y8G2_9PEZI|nr:Borealin N terminal-domain-containing protein [Microdochium trichocladiopsis]KAH7031613.1 Borealin N terminal-domain-containing protein [Microdochium trichocladiopsis]